MKALEAPSFDVNGSTHAGVAGRPLDLALKRWLTGDERLMPDRTIYRREPSPWPQRWLEVARMRDPYFDQHGPEGER